MKSPKSRPKQREPGTRHRLEWRRIFPGGNVGLNVTFVGPCVLKLSLHREALPHPRTPLIIPLGLLIAKRYRHRMAIAMTMALGATYLQLHPGTVGR